jgi:GNAT superfamily N-acetyltransferase
MLNRRFHLFDDYFFREATPNEFEVFFSANRSKVFTNGSKIMVEDWMLESEKQKRKQLSEKLKDRYEYRIFILKGDEIVGWHVGRQIDAETYYMGNTGVFQAHQRQGIYTALLPKLLETFREKGFQTVCSRHIASNNSVLIPKLRAGFMITGVEVDIRFGVLIVLSYIFDEKRRTAHHYRTGYLRADDDLKPYL